MDSIRIDNESLKMVTPRGYLTLEEYLKTAIHECIEQVMTEKFNEKQKLKQCTVCGKMTESVAKNLHAVGFMYDVPQMHDICFACAVAIEGKLREVVNNVKVLGE